MASVARAPDGPAVASEPQAAPGALPDAPTTAGGPDARRCAVLRAELATARANLHRIVAKRGALAARPSPADPRADARLEEAERTIIADIARIESAFLDRRQGDRT